MNWRPARAKEPDSISSSSSSQPADWCDRTLTTTTLDSAFRLDRRSIAPVIATGLAFLVLFWSPLVTLVRDWLTLPEAGHGLLLGPLAIYLAWRRGLVEGARGQPLLGILLLVAAVFLRYMSGLAAELFTMRMSMLGAAAALVIFTCGWKQLLRWWLPVSLLVLSVPLPAVLTGTLALPLQLKASQLGAWLLDARHVPVQVTGNVIHVPGRSLFITEACSGLRSLTALLSLGLLIGGLWLTTPWTRLALVVTAIPVAMVLNGIRVFLTGYLTYFVSPSLGEGFMHYSQGWGLFVIALMALAVIAWALRIIERRIGDAG